MPELPEVETARRQLEVLKGFVVKKVIVRDKNGKQIRLRKEVPADKLKFLVGKELLEIKRRSKYLFLKFEDYYLVCHFGMTGMLYKNNHTNHEVVRLEGVDGSYISYCDTRKFGIIDIVKEAKVSAYLKGLNLGFEPFGHKINVAAIQQMLAESNTPLKEWLLDQSKITGIGNIYASEICFAVKLHPKEKACNCQSKADKIMAATIKILRAAVENGGSTVNSYSTPDGKKGKAQLLHKVYGREGQPCVKCQSPIKRIQQAGRSTFFCENCQKTHS